MLEVSQVPRDLNHFGGIHLPPSKALINSIIIALEGSCGDSWCPMVMIWASSLC